VTDSATGRGVIRGALIGAGAAVKAWPLTLLAGLAPGRRRGTLVAMAAVLAAVCLVFPRETANFLAHENARGVEIESVAATPFMIWRHSGWSGTMVFQFGSYQLSGAYVAFAQDAARLGLVLVTAAVLGWQLLLVSGRVRWRPEFAADAPLAATLLYLVVSPLLSAQYLLWVTGLGAACLATGRTTQRPAALAVLAAAWLTQLVFPIWWRGLVYGSDLATSALTARNLLLVAAAALSCWRIARTAAASRATRLATRSQTDTTDKGTPDDDAKSRHARGVAGRSRRATGEGKGAHPARRPARRGAPRPAVGAHREGIHLWYRRRAEDAD
jgi:hypothetical protein